MQSRGLEIVVGMFICIGIAAVFVLTMRVSNLANAGPSDGYAVTAAFANVGGLKNGAPVEMAGVGVGRVSNIEIDPQTYEAVVTMSLDGKYEIPTDSDAAILTAGLLGEQYIGLGPGAADKYLTSGDEIRLTQSAVVLEDIIGQVLYNMTSSGSENGGGGP